MTDRLSSIRATLEAHEQPHLLRFHDDLDGAGRAALIDQLAAIDFDGLDRLIRAHLRADTAPPPPPALSPCPYHPYDPDVPWHDQVAAPGEAAVAYDAPAAREAGAALVASGRVAVFTVAGGQGTRLGWNGPKGTYPATAVTGKPLFRVFAEHIVAAQKKYGATIPWYIMTSPENDGPTRAFFLDNNCFGLLRKNIFMFPQGMLPAVDADTGHVLLAERGGVALSPDGHGGSIRMLRGSGALEDMTARGIQQISYHQVDNPLVRAIDPLFIGLHATSPESSGEMSSKMVAKVDPDEPVGVFVRSGGDTRVIEYSNLPRELAHARDASGGLRFNAGSPAIHLMSVAFVERLTGQGDDAFALPYHAARKKVSHVDPESGEFVQPAEPNAIKFESFVFDALPLAERSMVYETDRTEEFAPIKNAAGGDSPATSHRLQTERAARWLAAHGVDLPRGGDGHVDARIEISPLTALEAADLVAVDLPGSVAVGEEIAI
jgi:UDP-N-acetylglucosamine/UDP-N-acetylgalactosamine diphosphorylase